MNIYASVQIENFFVSLKFRQRYQNFHCFENSAGRSAKKSLHLRNAERGTVPNPFNFALHFSTFAPGFSRMSNRRSQSPHRIMQGLWCVHWSKEDCGNAAVTHPGSSPSLLLSHGEAMKGRTWLWAPSAVPASSDQCGIWGPALCTPLSDECQGESSWETGQQKKR